MPELTLFDAVSSDDDAPARAASRDAGGRSVVADADGDDTPGAIDHLIGRLERQQARTAHRTFHPREDRMWINREGGQYSLSVGHGREEFPLSGDGIRQLAGLLDVPKTLLDRLSGLPNDKIEDCRLLNMLLSAEGARKEACFLFRIEQGVIVAAHTGRFTPLSNLELARSLAERQERGELRVKWYDLHDDALRLEIAHPGRDPLDLSPDLPGDREATPDLWYPGAVLLHEPSGGRAVTVFPTLFRRWGNLTLSVVASKDDVRKQRHADRSEASLLRSVLANVVATREAPFDEAGRRLKSLHTDMIRDRGAHAFLEGISLPFPNKGTRHDVVAQVTAGRPSVFRLVTTTLKVAKQIDDPLHRHRLELATGRFVWSRTGG